jgi:hypothetical protein
MNSKEMRVRLFKRKPVLVHVFQVPPDGKIALEQPPQWLIDRWASGEIFVNSFGGLTLRTPWGTRGCMPGDYVTLSEYDEIGFIAQDKFEHELEPA